MGVRRRPIRLRRHGEESEVEPRRVPTERKEFDVADVVTLAAADNDRSHAARIPAGLARTINMGTPRTPEPIREAYCLRRRDEHCCRISWSGGADPWGQIVGAAGLEPATNGL